MKRPLLFLYVILAAYCLTASQANAEEAFTYKDESKRDPFVPLVDEQGRYAAESGELYSVYDLNVSGILWDPHGKSSVLINDQMVTQGQTLYGFFIKLIEEDSITVSKDGQEYILRLTGEKEEKQ